MCTTSVRVSGNHKGRGVRPQQLVWGTGKTFEGEFVFLILYGRLAVYCRRSRVLPRAAFSAVSEVEKTILEIISYWRSNKTWVRDQKKHFILCILIDPLIP